MTGKNKQFNSRNALVVPNGFIVGDAAGGGDCFFDSVAQGMNELRITGEPFDVRVLRKACFNYAHSNEKFVYDSRNYKTWRQAIEEDAVAGRYAENNRQGPAYFYTYMANIGKTAAESSHWGSAIWGRPEIEGRMLCQIYGIKIHVIEILNLSGQDVICHQLVDSSGSRSVDENSNFCIDPQAIHILNEGLSHFVPILRKRTVPNTPKEKEVYTSHSEGMQSSKNPTDGLTLYPVESVADSRQQVSLFEAQPESPNQRPLKTESTSESKTHQAIDSKFIKVCSLTDKSTWFAVVAEREDADFKILRITNSATVNAALNFILQKEILDTFNQASHCFFIVIEVAGCSEFPSTAVERLSKVLAKQKPVIIQWDFMDSAEHFVFFKQTGDSAFTQLQMDSYSLFSTECDLISELSNQGSFKLPLLLKTLKLCIGGQFNGGALDLLNVSFDVKREIDTWRLIDYAARDDDSLSLRFLLLVDWDLKLKNGDGRRTLEIAAEYGGPHSMSALLNLPITCSEEEHFLSSEEIKLLALRNYLGDNPLLIAAGKKRPETLKFLIRCGADIHFHRGEDEKLTAIAIARDKKCYENMLALLEADSPFPDKFDLSKVEHGKNTAALLKHIDDRQSFHQAIKNGSEEFVKKFIKNHPRLKQAYDPSNQSALMTALKAGQYEIYALLQSEGLCAGKNEQLSVVKEGLTVADKHRLKQAKLKYFGKHDDSHIIYLLSKSRLVIGRKDKKDFCIILKLYKQLNKISEISTILKVVEHSDSLDIIFDFNRDSVIDLDPTQSSKTRGVCDYRSGRICVGAKEESELLGTLAHELTHLAMNVCYNNECNPYDALDEQRKCEFEKIVADCSDRIGIDEIIRRVFTVYKDSNVWPSELIVRVPHMLAHYMEEQGKQLLTQQVPELFNFYVQNTKKDLRKFIADPAAVKSRHQIQRVNDLLGKLDEIKQSNIWLSEKCLLNDDVINCQHIQIFVSSLPRLTILNLYQVFRKKQLTTSDNKCCFIFVSAKEFQNQEKAKAIYEAFQSVANPRLVIDCSYEYDKSETDLLSTLNSFSDKGNTIFIADTAVARSLQEKFKMRQVKIMQDREYDWSDITSESQRELLKNTIHFQGSPVSLNELISAESPVRKCLPLADLLDKKPLEIGRPLLTSTIDGSNENYYIPRTFSHQVAIKKDIFEKQFSDLVATTEQEFIKCCQDNPERNVHWLLKDKSGRLIWQNTKGSLSALRDYIDTQNPLSYSPENLEEFFHQAQRQKVMLIADFAGMGKTTVLTQLSEQIKQKFQNYWLLRINLNDHTDVLEAQGKQNIGSIEFLVEKLFKFRYPYEKELFKQCCQGSEKATKVVLMFDGLDEISPKYKETVLKLLQDLNPLKQPGIEQLWVTTRPHLRDDLEDTLLQFCYTLQPFSEENQVGFLTKFWRQHSHLQEENQKQLETYARALIEKLAQSISDREREFTGIPLQTRMLAEAFKEEVKTHCLSHKSEPELPKQLRLADLYVKFITEKINIYMSKGKIATTEHSYNIVKDISITKNHQKMALEVLLPEVKDTVLKLEKTKMLAPEKISRIGILQYIDEKLYFIHRTFAEYYVADFLATQLTEEIFFLPEVLNMLFKILLEEDYAGIRYFLNEVLVNPHESIAIKEFGKQINKIWKAKLEYKGNILTGKGLKKALCQAAADGNNNILHFFFSSLKASENSDVIKELLVDIKKTAWHLAAWKCNKEILGTLWFWGKDVQVNLKDDLLLSKNSEGQTAWHRAAFKGNMEILEQLWCWGKEVKANLKDDLLLSKNSEGQTAWHRAAFKGNIKILEKLWCWGEKVKANLKDDLLLSKNSKGQTAWHRAAFKGNKEILKKLWCWGEEVKANLIDDLLLSKDFEILTPLQKEAIMEKREVLVIFWPYGRDVQINLENYLLLSKKFKGQRAWNIAAFKGNKEILEKLWCWGKELQLNLKYNLLLSKDFEGKTAWNIVAFKGNKEILEKLWCWGGEVQVDLKVYLLFFKDVEGKKPGTEQHLRTRKRC